jgi:hypothetical protein
MNHYDTIHEEDFEKYHVIASITYEDLHPSDCFDETVHDMNEILRKIDNGFYTWFCLRVQAFRNGVLLGTSYLGGNLYEDPREIIIDGTYQDCKHEAIQEAEATLSKLLATI